MIPADVSTVIVTRGDVDLTDILAEHDDAGVSDILIWNNQLEQDLGPYGKYAAIGQARHDVILVQDDDVLLPAASITALAAAYQPGFVTANMPAEFRPHYPDSAMVGFGAIFDRDLPAAAFARFFAHHPWMSVEDPLFLRESCRAFTVLTPVNLVDLPKTDLPWASDPGRLWRQPEHVEMRERMLTLARLVRDGD